MQSATQPQVSHEVVSAGVDWITATASNGFKRWDFQTYADEQRRRFMDSGEPIKTGYRLGFFGWQTPSFFYGTREGCSMIVASGAQAHSVFPAVAHLAENVSRLDLQVTVATPDERPHLGLQAYRAIQTGQPSKRKVKNATLIDSHPHGETCSIGKRKSDQYGRLYDKATEAQLGEPRSLWRYEVELKRGAALTAASDLRAAEFVESRVSGQVWEWFDTRGVVPIYTPALPFCSQKPGKTEQPRDVLLWFEQSVSTTVARAIRRYGLKRVVEALKLDTLVQPVEKGR